MCQKNLISVIGHSLSYQPNMKNVILKNKLVLISIFFISFLFIEKTKAELVSKPDFEKVKKVLCKVAVQEKNEKESDCGFKEAQFETHSVDINADGQPEFSYKNNEGCGAHVNCDFYLLQKKGINWIVIASDMAQTLWLDNKSTKGYKNFFTRLGSSACESVFKNFIWNGNKYIAHTTVCNYCDLEKTNKKNKMPPLCETDMKKINTLFTIEE